MPWVACAGSTHQYSRFVRLSLNSEVHHAQCVLTAVGTWACTRIVISRGIRTQNWVIRIHTQVISPLTVVSIVRGPLLVGAKPDVVSAGPKAFERSVCGLHPDSSAPSVPLMRLYIGLCPLDLEDLS